MKKNIKSVLAKALAVALAFSVAGVTPGTDAQAAKKPVSVTKKVTVNVGKSKKVKVTTKKKVKETTWTLDKKGKKVVKLSKKTKKNVTIKGKKAGKGTLTAKVKIGKKTYKLKTKITVKKASNPSTKPTATPAPTAGTNGGNTTKPTTVPTTVPTKEPAATEAPVGEFTVNGVKMTVEEADTYSVPLTELNETTFSSYSKCPEPTADTDYVAIDTFYNRDGSVTWTSAEEYNSGLSFYINPCTSEDDIVDISETRGEGFKGFLNGTKDVSAYDYIRVKVTSANEMNVRTYCGNGQLTTAGFPGSSNDEKYESGWIGPVGASEYMESDGGTGQVVKSDYETRTLFIPMASLTGTDFSQLTAIAFCPQRDGIEVTLHAIDFVKVKYDTQVTGIEVTSNKEQIANGGVATVKAVVTPENATRKTVKWTSSDESLATVNFKGQVVAAAEGEGVVTITATATDGSDVSGSVDIQIGGETGEEVVVKTHKMNLADANIVGKTNPGEGDSIVATQTAAGIEFKDAGSMLFVNFSAYLEANNIDLANYTELQVTWEVQDAEGNAVENWDGVEGAPGYGKIAYVAAENLNGHANGIDINYEGPEDTSADIGWLAAPYVGETCKLTIAKTNPAELATVAGFNLQLEKLPAGYKVMLKDITLYKDYTVNFNLADANIVGKTNPGEGESVAATQTAAGIEFMDGKSMLFVNFSAYLEANNIDLANYSALEVKWEVQDAEGNAVENWDGVEGAPGYGKIAYVAAENLNGHANGIDINYEGPEDTSADIGWLAAPYVGETCKLTIAKTNPAELATVAGFNLQLEKLPEGYKVVVKSITFVW